MLISPFTASDVYRLTPEQVENVRLTYHIAVKESAYISGRASLSDALGEHLDDFELEMVEDAAKAMSDSYDFQRAITGAWLAYRFHRRIASLELKQLTRPWASRG